jgi:small subunit ribosomal protein MRP21
MQDMNRALSDAMPTRDMMNLTPRTGRTVHVGGNIDVGKGFRLLAQSCAKNRVKQDHTYQRFHERPGLKRKRLKSQRWRKRFMLGFRATVTRVKQLKAQGW